MQVGENDSRPLLRNLYREKGYWTGTSLIPFYERTCERWPEREAIVEGDVRLSFGEVRARVQRLSASLAELGVGRGTVVAVQLPNWWEALIVFWSLIRLGAVLNPVLPIYRRRELEFILRESGAEWLFVPGHFRKFDHRTLAAELQANQPELRRVVVVRDEPLPGQLEVSRMMASPPAGPEPRLELPQVPVGSDLLLLMYTSGTTADPKGVLHSHDTLLYEVRSLERVHTLGAGDTVLMPSPVTHVSGLIHAVLTPFVLGTRAVLMDSWDPDLALDLIRRESVTYMVGAPIFLADLTYHPKLAEKPPRTLRLFSCGGAGVSPDLILESRRRLGCLSKRVYGSTEFPSLTTTSPDDPPDRGAATEGRPIWAAELAIVDDEDRHLPPGAEGEILARGPECFLGYRNAALDREAFTADGWFRTGDLGVVDAEGYLTVTGRKKDIVIRKGEKISAAEIESMIVRHPAVADAAVIAIPDPVTGEQACACVRLREGQAISLASLGEFLLHEGLSRQKLPESVEIVTDLPRTASGKVQKQKLREAILRDRATKGERDT